MKDYHIRSALKTKLLTQYSNNIDTIIIEELGVNHGEVRVDLAVVNGFLNGYELKSDKDTLERLPHQVRAYNSIFDRMILVVGYRHAYAAIKSVPEWWGIKIAEKGLRGSINFHTVRRSLKNPTPDANSIIKLLWRDEAVSFLDEFSSADGLRSKPKNEIYKKITQIATLDMIRDRVRVQLKSRANWRIG